MPGEKSSIYKDCARIIQRCNAITARARTCQADDFLGKTAPVRVAITEMDRAAKLLSELCGTLKDNTDHLDEDSPGTSRDIWR